MKPRRPPTLDGRLKHIIDVNHGTFRGLVRTMLAQSEFVLGRLENHLHPDEKKTERLVFVCLGNINRSAFAAQVARKLGATAISIGLSTTTGASAFHKAVTTAPEFGVDLSRHLATDLKDYEFRPSDLLLAMEVRHAKQLVAARIPRQSIALLGHWASPHRIHLHDPHTLSDAYFRTCFTLIDSAVRGLAADLRLRGSPAVIP